MVKKISFIIFKTCIAFIALCLICFILLKLSFNDDVPQGQPGPTADQLGYNILKAIHHKQFTQATQIDWTFAGSHHYKWKLQQNAVDVFWDDYKVAYVTTHPQVSFAWKNGIKLTGNQREQAINKAGSMFNNDSFWLVAPHKIFDTGTERELITLDNGQHQLLVRYTTGGTTPGDVYVWQVDQQYRPIACRMWVDILPFKGVNTQWNQWQMTAGNFMLPNTRSIYGINIPITNVKVIK